MLSLNVEFAIELSVSYVLNVIESIHLSRF